MEELIHLLPPSSTLSWIEGADHFFTAYIEPLQERIAAFFRDWHPAGEKK